MSNMIQNETQAIAAATELRRRYSIEWHGVHGAMTAIEQMLQEDFPAPDGDTPPTRYQVDALRALKSELSALVEGWDRAG